MLFLDDTNSFKTITRDGKSYKYNKFTDFDKSKFKDTIKEMDIENIIDDFIEKKYIQFDSNDVLIINNLIDILVNDGFFDDKVKMNENVLYDSFYKFTGTSIKLKSVRIVITQILNELKFIKPVF